MKTIAHSTLNAAVSLPDYDRSTLKSRIIHLGFGAFHRAHQALFTNEMLSKTGSDWGICEINLFGGEELIQSLRAQDHLYTVAEKRRRIDRSQSDWLGDGITAPTFGQHRNCSRKNGRATSGDRFNDDNRERLLRRPCNWRA